MRLVGLRRQGLHSMLTSILEETSFFRGIFKFEACSAQEETQLHLRVIFRPLNDETQEPTDALSPV